MSRLAFRLSKVVNAYVSLADSSPVFGQYDGSSRTGVDTTRYW